MRTYGTIEETLLLWRQRTATFSTGATLDSLWFGLCTGRFC